jgi:2-C-methyl-D-erythritol 4-phosphate cytidylyltransferase / 2-C-methyl-D-erythritol 2,4-cyclodiphosphate synthase
MNQHAWVIVAGGRGTRMSASVPKQYRLLTSEPILTHSIRALLNAQPHSLVQIVIHPDDVNLYTKALTYLSEAHQAQILPFVEGGSTRQLSVRHGLLALASHLGPKSTVGIHDAARPFVTPALISALLEALSTSDGCVPVLPLTDSLKLVNEKGAVIGYAQREKFRRVQTPQVFHYQLITKAHELAFEQGQTELTDDAAVAGLTHLSITTCAGDERNIKITTEDDLIMAHQFLAQTCTDIRTGQGYDVHALGVGNHVWLGGVRIPHTQGLIGHSDADVLLHALTDAIYGALADGDIGSHFPPSDPQWKGASSDIFLRHAMQSVRERGGYVAHLDGTLVCEEPKIGPHRQAMRERIADITGLALDRIAVKATTSERLGFTGRKEGIAAYALATIRLPEAQ